MKQTNRRTFTAEFKKQMVQLYQNGKARQEIIKEYDLTPSALDEAAEKVVFCKKRGVLKCILM